MPLPTVVETPRLILRPPTEADRDEWVRLHRDPRTYGHAPWAMAASDDEAGVAFEAAMWHWQEHGFGFWVAREQDSGPMVGVGGLRETRGDADYLNLYYRLAFDDQGRGLGRELSRFCTAFAVEYVPHLPVWALIGQNNPASIATAEASGLERCGIRQLKGDPVESPPALRFEAPRVEGTTAFDRATRAQVLDLWMRTNDAGGAVGFLPGASLERVDAALSAHEDAMCAGSTTAILLRAAADDRVLGLAFIVPVGTPLMPHVATVYRVMTDPEARGRNLGRLLMAGVHRMARASRIEILTLGVRSGMGTSAFYEACGYREAGRVMGAIRVAPGDDRDDITMTRRLDDADLKPDPRN
ncbi:acetyltransferase [Knoellia sinensis KCTC 19936]|uniref:Acetyltransferase n=1 Tax=Knoellia sinensis KCTC 19936 TaxID=1385520 RepID=A0A0A0JCY3_9MICO|nr:GNAT family N-acetyltransferase [Knoellia sinensis]KGN34659.1 acetyltransferase [Knoellia sinensis KCTC 19936]